MPWQRPLYVQVAELTAQIDALENLRMQGIRSVTDENGERIDYASDREIAAALLAARRRLADLTAHTPVTTIRFNMTKGL